MMLVPHAAGANTHDRQPDRRCPVSARLDVHGIYQAALDSCRFNSMSPEKTARALADEYWSHLEAVQVELQKAATVERGPGVDAADREYNDYSEGFEQRWRAWIAARGRTASVMVTGASNFPAARNRKRLDTEQRRSEELTEWAERERKRALKRLAPEPDYAGELAKQEALLETMKACNKVVRRKWPDERKVAAMVADVGLSEPTARKVLEPDFAGRVGFPSHTLSSVRGKIKRLRANLDDAGAA